MSEETTALFAMPSLFEGVGRLFDFGNTMTEYNQSATGAEADAWALERDWRAVGNDILAGARAVAEETAAR